MKHPGSRQLLLLELFFIFVLAVIPRLWRLQFDLQITYDQGLHSQAVWNVWHDGKLSLLGHPTDVDGIYHAPVYYWLMLPFYVLGRGNPVYPAVWQALLHSFSAVLIYILARRLFDIKTARISAILFAASFGWISYARWLSNVSPVVPFALLFFITLEKAVRSHPNWFIFACLFASLVIECNGAIGVFLLPLLVIFFFKLRKPLFSRPRIFWLAALAFIIPHLPLLFFNLRHNFVSLAAIVRYSGGANTGIGLSLTTIAYDLKVFFNEIGKTLAWQHLPVLTIALSVTGFCCFRFRQHQGLRLIVLFILVPLIGLFIYKRGAIGFFFWSTLPLVLILIVYSLSRLPKFLFYFFVSVLLWINICYWPELLSPNFLLTPIGTRNLITHQDRLNVVDWIYRQAAGRPIDLWMYTIPYLLEDPWRYYFIWYGQAKYGYLPESWGGLSSTEVSSSSAFFAVYEPDYDKPDNFSAWSTKLNSQFPNIIRTFNSHSAMVDYRL
jgi:4-amino-4-deoxy-L-arabinose transferase-like glycosyltransferase